MNWKNNHWYFKPRKFEYSIYEYLGIKQFKKCMLRLFGLELASKLGWYPFKDRSVSFQRALIKFYSQTIRNESAHLLVLVGLVFFSLNLLKEGDYPHALVVIIINIPFNIYPVMLQRYNRGRVKRVLESTQ